MVTTWAYAYMVPLWVGVLALICGTVQLLRGRLRSPAAWLPVMGSLALVVWLIAYVYFGAFRAA